MYELLLKKFDDLVCQVRNKVMPYLLPRPFGSPGQVLTILSTGKPGWADPTSTAPAKLPQVITFGALSAKTTNDAPFTISASSNSGLPVTFTSSNTTVATVSGNTVTIIGAGTANITAHQPGNDAYEAATDVVRALVVTQAVSTFAAYWGWKSNNTLPTESEILRTDSNDPDNLQGTGSFNANAAVTVNYSGASGPKYLFMAEPLTQPAKGRWYENDLNNELIDANSTFRIVGTVGAFRIYATAFMTEFANSVQFQTV